MIAEIGAAASVAPGSLAALLAQAEGQGGLVGILPPILIMVAIFYFMIIRPQSKQAKQHREMLSGLKKGDEVITSAGIVGRVHAVTEKFVMVEVARDVRLRILKGSIQGKVAEGTYEGAEPRAESKDKGEK